MESTFVLQAAVFVVLYLQARGKFALPNQARSLFIVPFFQVRIKSWQSAFLLLKLNLNCSFENRHFFIKFLVVAASVFIAISRVMNNMHHPTDVIAGVIVGTLAQTLNCIFVQQLFCRRDTYESIPSNAVDMSFIQTETVLEDSNSIRNW